ncbi:MAG: hypothetical protein WAL46_00985, partial [Nitrososphaeraceae archaeon]
SRGNVGKLNEDRFTRYYCNKCTKEYSGSPKINYESPIETMGEGIILIDRRIYVQNMYQYISSLSQV